MVEYALVIAIIAIIAISGLSFLGNTVKIQINHISQGLIKGY
ncbi:MAG: Flp family type IVb pilin [Sulfobacillus benefaciens]|uniref:Flp family type IVb pilin n=1 Tax=Sulfobacillus benefaciens TaxID=453960 RepID=A0A2T2XK28_9FIRM|nr:MAG: Flp family type IVb pilin [Sulfobacillus benefaciens]